MEISDKIKYVYEDKNMIRKYLQINETIFDINSNPTNFDKNSLEWEFFDFSSNKHKNSLPKPEAFLIKMELDEFDIDEKGEILSRRIFENLKGFREIEYSELNKLENEISNYNLLNPNETLNLPKNFPISEILKIHQSNNFDCQSTIKSLLSFLEFQRNFFPIKITNKTIEILSKTGYLYVHGRDRCHRPILICRAESYMLNIKKYTYDEWLNAIIYFSEYVINYLLIPGQIESWNIIADMNNVSLMSLPSDFGKFLKFLQTFYKCRLNLVFVYGMNRFLDFLWKIIKNFLHANVEKKVVFMNENNKERIYELILPEQLEMKYGGKAKNLFESVKGQKLETNFNVESLFPPHFPNHPNQKEEDKEKLLTEEEYFILYKSNKICKPSPFINYNILDEKYGANGMKTISGKLKIFTKIEEVSVYEDCISKLSRKNTDKRTENEVSVYEDCVENLPLSERSNKISEDVQMKTIDRINMQIISNNFVDLDDEEDNKINFQNHKTNKVKSRNFMTKDINPFSPSNKNNNESNSNTIKLKNIREIKTDKKTDEDNFIEGESMYKSQSINRSNCGDKAEFFGKSISSDKKNIFYQTSNSDNFKDYSSTSRDRYPELHREEEIKGRCCSDGANKCLIF